MAKSFLSVFAGSFWGQAAGLKWLGCDSLCPTPSELDNFRNMAAAKKSEFFFSLFLSFNLISITSVVELWFLTALEGWARPLGLQIIFCSKHSGLRLKLGVLFFSGRWAFKINCSNMFVRRGNWVTGETQHAKSGSTWGFVFFSEFRFRYKFDHYNQTWMLQGRRVCWAQLYCLQLFLLEFPLLLPYSTVA